MLDLTAFDALSFDCYGTLIDWEPGILAVLGPRARRTKPEVTDEALLAAFAANEDRVEAEHPAMLYSHVLRETFRGIGADLGFEVSDSDAAALGDSVPDWPAFPDSAEALRQLKQRYRLIILSNVHREGFAGSNRRLGVEFDAVLTAQDIGSFKPSDRNFEALLAKTTEMGIAPGRLLHVAQSLYHDHVPAKRAGLPTVWINRRGLPGGAVLAPDSPVTPDLEYASMAAFAAAVDEAFSAV
ncbi:MAG: haloacid dehalogenase type II [Dehalococcoidia bacterium]